MSAGVESELPFTMVVDDPSGNSFVENPSAPNRDPALTVRYETIQWLAINHGGRVRRVKRVVQRTALPRVGDRTMQ